MSSSTPLTSEGLIPVVGLLIGLIVIVVDEFLREFKFQSGKEKFYFTMALFVGRYLKEIVESIGKKLLTQLNKETVTFETQPADPS